MYPDKAYQQDGYTPVPDGYEPPETGDGCLASLAHAVVLFALALAAAILIRTFVGEPYYVPTGSMLETIQLNDRVWGEKLSYRFRTPEVGEVVVFPDPADASIMLIKRVVATGGQTVDFQNGQLVVDGVVQNEPYTLGKPSEPLDSHASTLIEPLNYPYRIPENSVWVMGDNRTNSLDSRYFGAVETGVIRARAVVVFWPAQNWQVL